MRSASSNIAIAVIIAIFIIGNDSGSAHDDFGYHGERGPSHWADDLKYGSCAGKLQSPIDIDDHTVTPIRFPPLRFKGFKSVPVSSTLSNNGHTVMLQIETSETATISGGPLSGIYVFSQLHFHWGANDSFGSEDLINNHSFPMELHMVFFKIEYGDMATALHYKDGLCVLAIFYEAYTFENSVYSEIVEHLDSVTQPHTKARLHAPMTLDDLLPSNKHHYYTYNGSLTTPPCSEVVTWIDFKEPIPLSSYQIAAFRRLKSNEGEMTENFRPVQPLGDRIVFFNVGERNDISYNRKRDYFDLDNSSSTIFSSSLFLYLLTIFWVLR